MRQAVQSPVMEKSSFVDARTINKKRSQIHQHQNEEQQVGVESGNAVLIMYSTQKLPLRIWKWVMTWKDSLYDVNLEKRQKVDKKKEAGPSKSRISKTTGTEIDKKLLRPSNCDFEKPLDKPKLQSDIKTATL